MASRTKLAPDLMQEIGFKIFLLRLRDDGINFSKLRGQVTHVSRALGIPVATVVDFVYQLVEEHLDEALKGLDEAK